jgi:hypothetical protein
MVRVYAVSGQSVSKCVKHNASPSVNSLPFGCEPHPLLSRLLALQWDQTRVLSVNTRKTHLYSYYIYFCYTKNERQLFSRFLFQKNSSKCV